MFSETWHTKTSNINIDGYNYFSCPRPKFNRKAKRDSGGVIVYFKQKFTNYIELINSNQNGIIWFKLNKKLLLTDNDAYICTCYVPPEESTVYKNINSSLFEFDFFEHLNNNIRHYSNLGDVYLNGDLNSRTGLLSDCVDNIHLDRYVDMPYDDLYNVDIPPRANNDTHVNSFGHKLLSLCKENDLHIVNGRLTPGLYTYNGIYRNRSVSSTVDYLITNHKNFSSLNYVLVHDMTEFADHCPIIFSLKHYLNSNVRNCYRNIDKIVWKPEKADSFNDVLNSKKYMFDD